MCQKIESNTIKIRLTFCKYCLTSIKSSKSNFFCPNWGITSRQSDLSNSGSFGFFTDNLLCFSLCELDMATATFCQIFLFSMAVEFPFPKWLPVGVNRVSETPRQLKHWWKSAFHFWFGATQSLPKELGMKKNERWILTYKKNFCCTTD